MTKHGAGTARQDSRHPVALDREPGVPDRVDPAMKAMEPATPHSAPDLILGEPD
jgi:hypothetical protein